MLNDLLFLVPLSLFFLFFHLGSGSLASWDEAIYAVVSREILRSGNWLRLTFEGSLWFDKPPLALWATAFFYKIFGVSEFSARFFSALCGVGTVTLTYFLGRRLFSRWVGLCGALILLSSSHFLRFARFGMLDSPFLFFMTLSLYLFWLGHDKNRYLIFSGVAIGLAVMTKGFAGILIFPIIWIYAIWSDRLEILGRSSYWIGVMLAVLVALPWNFYELMAHHDFFMRDVVIKHLFYRTTGAIEGHSGNAFFYVRVLVNKYHPWVLVGIFSAPFFLWKAFKDREGRSVFIAVWIFFIFGVMTLVRTKLPWYIFPLYPALSLSVAYFFVKIFKESYALHAKLLFVAVLVLHAGYSHLLRMDYSRPIKNLAPLVTKTVPANDIIYLYRYHEQPAAVFYFERKIQYLDTPADFETQAATNKGFYCLVRAEDMKELAPLYLRFNISPASSSDGVFFLFTAPN